MTTIVIYPNRLQPVRVQGRRAAGDVSRKEMHDMAMDVGWQAVIRRLDIVSLADYIRE
jgi:hypothetical protein